MCLEFVNCRTGIVPMAYRDRKDYLPSKHRNAVSFAQMRTGNPAESRAIPPRWRKYHTGFTCYRAGTHGQRTLRDILWAFARISYDGQKQAYVLRPSHTVRNLHGETVRRIYRGQLIYWVDNSDRFYRFTLPESHTTIVFLASKGSPERLIWVKIRRK